MRHLRIEEQEMREVQLILWRERALVAERAVRELEVVRGQLLDLVGDSLEQRAARRVTRYGLVAPECETCRDTGQVARSWGTPDFGGGSIGACPDCDAWRRYVVTQ